MSVTWLKVHDDGAAHANGVAMVIGDPGLELQGGTGS